MATDAEVRAGEIGARASTAGTSAAGEQATRSSNSPSSGSYVPSPPKQRTGPYSISLRLTSEDEEGRYLGAHRSERARATLEEIRAWESRGTGDGQVASGPVPSADVLTRWVLDPDERVAAATVRAFPEALRMHREAQMALYRRAIGDADAHGEVWTLLLDVMARANVWPAAETRQRPSPQAGRGGTATARTAPDPDEPRSSDVIASPEQRASGLTAWLRRVEEPAHVARALAFGAPAVRTVIARETRVIGFGSVASLLRDDAETRALSENRQLDGAARAAIASYAWGRLATASSGAERTRLERLLTAMGDTPARAATGVPAEGTSRRGPVTTVDATGALALGGALAAGAATASVWRDVLGRPGVDRLGLVRQGLADGRASGDVIAAMWAAVADDVAPPAETTPDGGPGLSGAHGVRMAFARHPNTPAEIRRRAMPADPTTAPHSIAARPAAPGRVPDLATTTRASEAPGSAPSPWSR